jgi:hypothetical protein
VRQRRGQMGGFQVAVGASAVAHAVQEIAVVDAQIEVAFDFLGELVTRAV